MNISAPDNIAKLGAEHSNIQTTQSCPSLFRIEPTMHYSHRIVLSQRISPPCLPVINKEEFLHGMLEIAKFLVRLCY